MKQKLKEINIDGERVFLKRSGSGWRVVFPIKIDSKINWKNFIAGGNWFNLLKVAAIVLVIIIFTSEYASVFKVAQDCLNTQTIIFP